MKCWHTIDHFEDIYNRKIKKKIQLFQEGGLRPESDPKIEIEFFEILNKQIEICIFLIRHKSIKRNFEVFVDDKISISRHRSRFTFFYESFVCT